MNAYALAEIGAAMVLEETNLKEHILTDAIGKILDNQEVSSAMSEKIKTFYHPAAAEVIAKGLIELARS
jgi:UDP-N-acetylglucosamine:LPS N-acetylglucosamine transferase